MKSFKLIIPALLLLLFANACNDNFLEKYPETALTDQVFFSTPEDLATYTYGLYSMLPISYDDNNSDNILYTDGSSVEKMIAGGVNPDNTASWGWGGLRRINYLLDNASKVKGDPKEINHYVGVARFFRALFYFNMVKTFGDVPWYDHALKTNETEELYKGRDSRAFVMKKVFEDLDFAVQNVKPKSDATVLGKFSVEAIAARIALYEGTFRKYHGELNLTDGNEFIKKASVWSKDVMDNGGFTLTPMAQFASMFNDNTLASNKEVILYKKHSKDFGVGNNTHIVCDVYWGLSQSLMCEYLNEDGSRFTSLPNYDKKSYVEVFKNRDPRFAATFLAPGVKLIDESKPHVVRLEFGGYPQHKFYPSRKELACGWDLNYTDLPIIRLAEMYLIYAESKAELNEITQADLNISINKLRARAGLPSLNMSANADVDPYLEIQHSNVSGDNKGIILEIRRERRVEMACEGLRHDDLFRWKLGSNLVKFVRQGCYIPQLGAIDLTGDGNPDLAILASPQEGDQEKYKGLILKYLKDSKGVENSYYLENKTSGHIQYTGYRINKREFIEPKYYYYPIPTSQTVLNRKLVQMYGWENK